MRLGARRTMFRQERGRLRSSKRRREKKNNPLPQIGVEQLRVTCSTPCLCLSPLLPLPHAANLRCDSQP